MNVHSYPYIFSHLVFVWIVLKNTTSVSVSVFAFFFFFLGEKRISVAFMLFQWVPCTVHRTYKPLFNKIFIKNGSYGTIHTFKNYFATMFSVFSFQQ